MKDIRVARGKRRKSCMYGKPSDWDLECRHSLVANRMESEVITGMSPV